MVLSSGSPIAATCVCLIERCHQRCLPTILNIHWSDFVTNIEVLVYSIMLYIFMFYLILIITLCVYVCVRARVCAYSTMFQVRQENLVEAPGQNVSTH